MKGLIGAVSSCVAAGAVLCSPCATPVAARSPTPTLQRRGPGSARVITPADCSIATVGGSIPVSSIGEPVAGVVMTAPRWVEAAGSAPAYCAVDGSMAPVDRGAPSINLRVLLPAEWSRRAVQLGGSGLNGTIPNLSGNEFPLGGSSSLSLGFAKYGSDSGHQGRSVGRGNAGVGSTEWTLHDEAMKNLGYSQMKKTHDAAMVIIERMYGERPRFNYFTGASQGGREALTVAQRYPADYDGVVADVPIVGFSSLMLAPELIRIQEKPIANWVPPIKVNAIRGEFMRQCDLLDGLVDGRINNYMACRAIFDLSEGAPYRRPWMAMRCPNNIDPDPANVGAGACLTDGQIATLEVVYSRYPFATPLANNVTSFGMWVPNTDPGGSGLITDVRYKGQEGAGPAAPVHSHLGSPGVTGFLFRNLQANPLDYVEGGFLNGRRVEISAALDATNPDLTAFARRGGKVIVTIGTNDTLASPGAQLDYYQSVIDRMGQAAVDDFARLFVIPQVGHSLTGTSYSVDGAGNAIDAAPIPSRYDRFGVLVDWVERNVAPARTLAVTADRASLPLCSYPAYPRYVTGPVGAATSYRCEP
jgi:pimeloyl-ACP methyl ester carboxylesterase